jgi:hypothetical protein
MSFAGIVTEAGTEATLALSEVRLMVSGECVGAGRERVIFWVVPAETVIADGAKLRVAATFTVWVAEA